MIDRYNWNSPYEAPPLILCTPNNTYQGKLFFFCVSLKSVSFILGLGIGPLFIINDVFNESETDFSFLTHLYKKWGNRNIHYVSEYNRYYWHHNLSMLCCYYKCLSSNIDDWIII